MDSKADNFNLYFEELRIAVMYLSESICIYYSKKFYILSK